MSIAKGIVKTAENVVKMNADTMQIFSRNPRGSNYKDPTVKEAEEFQRIRREAGFGAILAHAPYTMNLASAKPENITVLLETMSGKGTEIGWRFEELKAIRDGVSHPERIGICLDTCHVFAAGYDIVNDLDGVLEEFDKVLGLELLRAIHLNDSMMPFGSRKDRHAVIGGGEIGMEALLNVMRHPKLKDLPFYLETPLDDAGHKEEIARLRDLA